MAAAPARLYPEAWRCTDSDISVDIMKITITKSVVRISSPTLPLAKLLLVTHRVHAEYTQSTRRVHAKYTQSTHRVHIEYTQSTHRVHIAPTCYTMDGVHI